MTETVSSQTEQDLHKKKLLRNQVGKRKQTIILQVTWHFH